jgi:phosphatidyl-myo-inositol dimannoside synthase
VRVLVLSPDFPPMRGGIQLLVHRVVSNASRLDLRVVTLQAPGARSFDDAASLDIRRAHLLPGPKPISTLALNARAVWEGVSFRPDCILSAHIVTSPAAAVLRRMLQIPVVQYFHAKEVGVRPRLAGFAARTADANVVVSQYTRELVTGVGGSPERIHCVHPGVDLPSTVEGVEEAQSPTIVTVARLEDRYKGHDVLVRAMPLIRARIPNVQWVVIGEGPLEGSLRALSIANGLSSTTVRFLGAVSDAERDEWLARANVFTMPSRLPADGYAGEGFGIVFLEAGAYGVPVVAGRVGGALDAVADRQTGLLVDPNDHVAVADALIRLLSDKELASELGAAGRRRAHAFSWGAVAGHVEEIVAGLVDAS